MDTRFDRGFEHETEWTIEAESGKCRDSRQESKDLRRRHDALGLWGCK